MGAWHQLRYSARSLARTPGATLLLLVSIAAGVGSNAAVVGFTRGLVAGDLPLPGIERIVSLFGRDAQGALEPLSYDGYVSLRESSGPFEIVGGVRETRRRVALDNRPHLLAVATITPEVAELLQLPDAGSPVISGRLWRDVLSTPPVEELSMQMAGETHRVGGVAPDWLEGLYAGSAVDLWLPAALDPDIFDRASRSWWVLARLQPGVSSYAAQGTVNASRSGDDVLSVLPYTGVRPEAAGGISRVGALLTAAAAAVFIIACANVATFLLSRSSARARETAVRVALGASRRQLTTQLLADSALISLAGGALGLLFATWTAQSIPALFFEQDAAELAFTPDALGILLASLACIVVTIACGMVPLFELRHDDPAAVLRRESAGISPRLQRVRTALVVAQMAGCCVLVVGAALLAQGFRNAWRTSVGHALGPTIVATLQPLSGFGRMDRSREYFRTAESTARALPGIHASAWVSRLPGATAFTGAFRVEPPAADRKAVEMATATLSTETLPLVALPPAAGRMFSGGDRPGACRVVILNQAAADAVLGGDAVGRAMLDPAGDLVEIVGVVRPSAAWKGPDRDRPTVFYYDVQGGAPSIPGGRPVFQVPIHERAREAVLDVNVVSRSYFDVMRLPAVDGALFPEAPDPAACRVGVINQLAANMYFGGNAVGGALLDTAGNRTRIVGVVQAVPLRASQRRLDPAIYLPMEQDFVARMSLMLPANATDEMTVSEVRRVLASIEGAAEPVVTTLEAHFARTALAAERLATTLVGASAALALALGGLGLYGAMNDAGRQRRREFAVRMALGASGWHIIRQVLAEGLRLVAAGTLGGVLGSLLLRRWFAQAALGATVEAFWGWIAAPVVLTIALVIASILPARRALGVSPLTVMKDE